MGNLVPIKDVTKKQNPLKKILFDKSGDFNFSPSTSFPCFKKNEKQIKPTQTCF